MEVYLSSSYSDLRSYRQAAIDQLRRLNIDTLGMEYFGTTATPPLEQCLAAVDVADAFILLIGHRYGFIPEGYDKSITQLEFERAVARRIPIFAFVLSDRAPVTISDIEPDRERRQQLSRFKSAVVGRRLVSYINSVEEFSASLISSITQFQLQLSVSRPTSKTTKDLAVCRQEVEEHKKVIEDLRSKLKNLVPADPIWRGRNFQRDELLCFALLPFKEEFFEVYESAVAPAAEELGLRSLHAGGIFGTREVVEDIWDSICASRIVVVDVTGRNPNVFYELGISHTLGKDCVVITQDREDVPFDIRHRRFIEYSPSKITLLRSALKKTIQSVLSAPSSRSESRT